MPRPLCQNRRCITCQHVFEFVYSTEYIISATASLSRQNVGLSMHPNYSNDTQKPTQVALRTAHMLPIFTNTQNIRKLPFNVATSQRLRTKANRTHAGGSSKGQKVQHKQIMRLAGWLAGRRIGGERRRTIVCVCGEQL